MKETKEARKERQAQEEWRMVEVLRAAGNRVDAEFRVCEDRKWRVDYLITYGHRPRVVAVEIQGFGFGHVGRAGWLRDIAKAQAIAANGWLYVPVTREQVASGDALEALSRAGVAMPSAWESGSAENGASE